jgi:hypothetical protein
MVRPVLFLLAILVLTSFLAKKEQGEFKSMLIGKKIAETPLSEYIREDIKGDQLILFIAYGCSHCREATQKAIEFKSSNLIDDLIILGSEAGETDAKKTFVAGLGENNQLKLIDYDWANFPRKFTAAEKGFPNPPVIFYIHDNVIKKIMTEIPSAASFKKYKEKMK